MKNMIDGILSAIFTTFIYVFGGWDVALISLLIAIFIDYITGVLSAIYNKKLSSRTGLKGILKKVGYLCVVALSVVIDNITNETGIIRNLVIYFFVANDGISILENMSEMDIPLPKKLIEILDQIRKENDE